MARFIIRGGKPLTGTLTPVGNKNAALPMLAAAVLTDEPVTIRNVPDIADVDTMLALLTDLGVDITRRGHTVRLQAAALRKYTLDAALCRRARSSILLTGPLAARHGKAVFHPPGGDLIGRRRLDAHFTALKALGMRFSAAGRLRLTAGDMRGALILLDEASVTATENVMMAACLAPGKTIIYNAACEPHVQDLGRLLQRMGAKLSGLGTNRIIVQGVRRLHGATHTVGPDYVEIGSFLAAAAATHGILTVRTPGWNTFLPVIARGLRRLGVSWRLAKQVLRLQPTDRLVIQDDLAPAVPKIEDGVWPAFPSDLMSVAIVLATQASGTILFFEKLFESRMYFVDRLIDMGARIVQCDPHRVVVTGPGRLRAAHMTSPDIRAGMALITAALCAQGESVIENAQIVDRGYERIEEKLRLLGADIERAQ